MENCANWLFDISQLMHPRRGRGIVDSDTNSHCYPRRPFRQPLTLVFLSSQIQLWTCQANIWRIKPEFLFDFIFGKHLSNMPKRKSGISLPAVRVFQLGMVQKSHYIAMLGASLCLRYSCVKMHYINIAEC